MRVTAGDERRELRELGEREMRAAEDHHVQLAAIRGRQLRARGTQIGRGDVDRLRAAGRP